MDSSNNSSGLDLLALALGTHTVNVELLSPEQRFLLVRNVIQQCEPLKYFPGFQSLRDLTDWKRRDRSYETLPGALRTEALFGRFFLLSTLDREKLQGEDGAPLTYKAHLLLEDHGKLVSWEETTTEEYDHALSLWRETARESSFRLFSEGQVKGIFTYPGVILDIVRRLADAVEADEKKRFERLQHLGHATVHLQALKGRLTIGNPPDPDDDIPF